MNIVKEDRVHFIHVLGKGIKRASALPGHATDDNNAQVLWEVGTEQLSALIELEPGPGVTVLATAEDSRCEEPSFCLALLAPGQHLTALYKAYGKCLLTLTLKYTKEGVEVCSSLTPEKLIQLQEKRRLLPPGVKQDMDLPSVLAGFAPESGS